MHPQPRTLPNAARLASMSVNELMNATLRMSDILAEESAAISEMRYKDLPKLHEEKMQISSVLESYQHVMETNPDFVRSADEKTREELLLLTDDLAFSVEENFRKVAVAKAVNGRVLQAIMDVMHEQQRPTTYGRNGYTTQNTSMALSMNLNQQA